MTLWGYRHDYDTMGVPSYNETKGVTVMTMILGGYSHDDHIMVGPPLTVMTLWGALKKKRLMGYPFTVILWGFPHDYDTIGYPHDYEIIGDIYEHEFNGVPYSL